MEINVGDTPATPFKGGALNNPTFRTPSLKRCTKEEENLDNGICRPADQILY